MDKPAYHRVLLKLSGEALGGERSTGVDLAFIGQVCGVVKRCLDRGGRRQLLAGR